MNKDLTLLIMAAGMGSRFGGLKQIEPFGPNGEFLIDYSIYDAIRAGFNKVVFIIKEENYEVFKETIGKRVEDKIKVEYAFQSIDDLPEGYKCPSGREKPWGTAHAILSARNIIKEPFAIINGDDLYGTDAYKKMADFLKNNEDDNKYYLSGYLLKNTLSLNGAVKRGVCELDNENLISIIESSVSFDDGKMYAEPLDGSKPFIVSDDTLASMNMFGFLPSLFKYLEDELLLFLEQNKEDLSKCEFLIPDIVAKGIYEKKFTVEVLKTTSMWHGVTYKEDKEIVTKAINDYLKDGVYPNKLW